ncbi:MAG TPA: glycosyltransferase [Candidatus Polarisedimenticolia bacterium]|nr:glycosyltransferase [Candidatus Polarisedimenticolia bacterium]
MIGCDMRGGVRESRWLWVAGVVSLVLLVSVLEVTPLARQGYLAVYVLANLMLLLDLFDLIVRRVLIRAHTASVGSRECPTSTPLEVGRFTDAQVGLHVKPYAFLLSVHNLEDEVEEFVEEMLPLRGRTWIIDDGSTDGTVQSLRRAGFRCLEGMRCRKKPAAIRQLLRALDPSVETVIVMDPDCRLSDPTRLDCLERRIFEFQRSGMAAMAPRFRISEAGVLPAMQALEYEVSFSVLRKSLGDHCITSGLSFYRRAALASALGKHDLSVYAEDLKNSVILLSEGERIYHDERLVFDTAAKRSWRDLFSQRVGWYFGLLDVYVTQLGRLRSFWFRDVSRGYHFFVYTGVLAILLHPLRLLMLLVLSLSILNGLDFVLGLDLIPEGALTDPTHFLVAYLQYSAFVAILLLTAIRRRDRARIAPVAPLFFFYQLALVIPTTLGYLNWLSLRFLGRRIFADHFDAPEPGASVPVHP